MSPLYLGVNSGDAIPFAKSIPNGVFTEVLGSVTEFPVKSSIIKALPEVCPLIVIADWPPTVVNWKALSS